MTKKEQALQLGITEEEYAMIVSLLKREPNFLELSVFGVMWSEHCSYKSSIELLKLLPRKGTNLVVMGGEENAGIIDIGDGYACVFKIESHNHPSAIEPYQGAATGVGGINRDIFTTGAFPIAQLNALFFGDPNFFKTPIYLTRIVKGIGDYGNSFGVPTISGQTFFSYCYNLMPIVNAMSCGIVKKDKIIKARASKDGQVVVLLGALTGPDGIQGAAFASKMQAKDAEKDLPAVQIADPFMEKILLEAILEMNEKNLIEGMQDLGAGGISCASAEMSAKANIGMDIYLDKVPLRTPNMEPYQILISESQERMLIVTSKEKFKEIKKIADKWKINCVIIGKVKNEPLMTYYYKGEKVGEIPAKFLVAGEGAPVYKKAIVLSTENNGEIAPPQIIKFSFGETILKPEEVAFKFYSWHIPQLKNKKLEDLEDIHCENLSTEREYFLDILKQPNISSKKFVYTQYDRLVQTSNITHEGFSDAGVVFVRENGKLLAFSVDCNPHYVCNDPYKGTWIAILESARNLACVGAKSLGITNCLNFGNPDNPLVMWQFVQTIYAIKDACEFLNIPVTGGNVSFYNDIVPEENYTEKIPIPCRENSSGKILYKDIYINGISIFPTPVIGMMGIIEKPYKYIQNALPYLTPQVLLLIGKNTLNLNASEFLFYLANKRRKFYKQNLESPYFSPKEEKKLLWTLHQLIENKLILSIHDVSEGGIWTTLMEMLIHSPFSEIPSVSILVSNPYNNAFKNLAFWFGEAQGRCVASTSINNLDDIMKICKKNNVPVTILGIVKEKEETPYDNDKLPILICISSTPKVNPQNHYTLFSLNEIINAYAHTLNKIAELT